VDGALERARELGRQEGYFFTGQFESEWNVEENRTVLGPQILSQLPPGRLPDALVLGVGTGSTLIGVGKAFREVNPRVRLFAMEPSESRTILCGEIASHMIEGISDGFIPGIFQRHADLVDEVPSVSSADAWNPCATWPAIMGCCASRASARICSPPSACANASRNSRTS